jgi:hypothetical protein
MPTMNELLQADAANADVAKDILRALDPTFLSAFETSGDLFEQFNRCASQVLAAGDQDDDNALQAIAQRLGLNRDELLQRIKNGDLTDAIVEARQRWESMSVRQAQRLVLLLLHRYFRWGVTDLLRFRVTAAAGAGRLEAEAVALVRLFRDEPATATQWLQAGLDDAAGRRFHNQTRQALAGFIAGFGLEVAYERGSSSAQHVRIGSAVRGVNITDEGTVLRDQEIDPERAYGYLLFAWWMLTVQAKVFAALRDTFRETAENCEGWRASVNTFIREVDRLHAVLRERFPDEDAAMQAVEANE